MEISSPTSPSSVKNLSKSSTTNYVAYKGCDLAAEGDSGSVADWAEIAMSWAHGNFFYTTPEWANGNELINGHDDGTLDPQGIAIRAQAASILMRFDQNLVKD